MTFGDEGVGRLRIAEVCLVSVLPLLIRAFIHLFVPLGLIVAALMAVVSCLLVVVRLMVATSRLLVLLSVEVLLAVQLVVRVLLCLHFVASQLLILALTLPVRVASAVVLSPVGLGSPIELGLIALQRLALVSLPLGAFVLPASHLLLRLGLPRVQVLLESVLLAFLELGLAILLSLGVVDRVATETLLAASLLIKLLREVLVAPAVLAFFERVLPSPARLDLGLDLLVIALLLLLLQLSLLLVGFLLVLAEELLLVIELARLSQSCLLVDCRN